MIRTNAQPKDHFEGRWKKGKKYTLYAVVANNGTKFRSVTPKEKDEPYVIYNSETETFSANAGWEIVEMSEDSRLSAMGGNGGGASGQDGKDAGFGTISASVANTSGNPSVVVETSGPDTAKNINFKFFGLKGPQGPVGETPNISIGTVTTVEPGQPAAASMGGTPEAPVLNLSIPKGLVGATPNFTVGTVTTGEPGTPVVVTITGTAEAPVLNITIPQGMQGNTGSSVDYPFELVNNLTTDDATKGLSAAQGKVLDGKISQLRQKALGVIEYSFYSAAGEHSSTIDKHPIAYSANTPIKVMLSAGTGACDGTEVSVTLWDSNNVSVRQIPITLGQETSFVCQQDASQISFYLWRVTQAGTFDVRINYGGLEKDTAENTENIESLLQEVDGINKELDVFVEKTKNVFNPSDFSSYPGISMADGVVSGTALAISTAFGGTKYYPLYTQAFQENTQYTFSCKSRTDNEAGATGNGLQLRFVYTDGSVEIGAHSLNAQTDWAVLKGTSAANKTLVGVGLSFSADAGANNTWYIKEIQLEQGTLNSEYVPCYNAIDSQVRDIASGVRYSLDYSVFAVNTTNADREISGLNIANGEGGTLYVFPLPDDRERNNYHIRFYNGTTELAMLLMTGFGKISFTNTYGTTIDKIRVTIERVNVKVNKADVFIVPAGSNALAESYYAGDMTRRMERLFQGVRTIFDFSSEAIGGTYKGRDLYNISIPVGAAFTLYVTGNDDGANRYYFNLLNGTTNISGPVSAGNGNRVISLTNTYGSEITGVEMVVQEVNYAATYDILVIKDGDKDVALELDLLKKDISWLPDFLSVPDYYATMLSTKASSIRNAMLEADKNGSTFIFITDVHWTGNSQKSPALINYLLQRLPVTDVFFGGDVINGGVPETQIGYFEDFGKKMHQVAPRFFSVRGNHENNLNDGGTGFDGDYFYTLLLKYADYLVEPGEYDNYYFDNKTTKTRFIVLNTGQGGDHYTSEQSEWLSTILDGMPSGYHAIILLHMAYATESALQSGTMSPTMAAAASVADAFNAAGNGKKVEAFISGHLHNDANKVTSGGIPIILTDCDARQTTSGNPQTNGTINEQAFDVITIDYSGKITCTRIGRGNDREINY